jgi:LacI family transcriptional regulator
MKAKPHRVAVMLDLRWPYKRHSAIFNGIQQYAAARGWETIIDEFAHDTLKSLRGEAVPYDGVLARANRLLAGTAARRGVPVVNVWPSSPARHLLPGVFPDSSASGRLIAEHLLSRGFRSFATLTGHHNADHELEVREIARLAEAAGGTCSHELIPQNPWRDVASWRRTQRQIDRWMDSWRLPIGVYIGLEAEGRMVVQACRRRGWRVPNDVAIVAGKNEETLCEHPKPSLTSVEIGYDRIGFEAARLLDSLMAGQAAPSEPIRVTPVGMVLRESTDFYAVADSHTAAALAFIAANFHRRIGPDEVAAAIGVERRTLQNYFRKHLDRPIAAEIRRVRLERVKRELTQGRRTLTEIARDAGFGNLQRLDEIFRREIGTSPREYRKQRQVADRASALERPLADTSVPPES